jgi:outer membrane protein insertion porin family
MKFPRLHRLTARLVCVWCLFAAGAAMAQQPPAPAKPKSEPAKVKPEAPKPPANPFENVPAESTPKAAPSGQPQQQPPPATEAKPQLEAPKPTAEVKAPAAQEVVEAVEFRGARRVPQDTLRAMILTKKGDIYDEDGLHRDFMTLWNTGRFDDIRLEREPGKTGVVVRFVVVERSLVRSIKYEGNKSVTVSEILDRFKERRVGLTVETQYDPNKVQRASIVLKEYLAERGRQFATVEPQVRRIPPSSLEITFMVNEGPKVKVGNIDIEGNSAFKDREVIRAMKNLRPIGVPYSIFLEDMFSKSYDSTKLEEDKERVRDWYQQRGYFTAHTVDSSVKIIDVGGGKFRLPLIKPNKPGKNANLKVTVEEGRLYHLNNINFVGVKLFKTPDVLMKPVFQMGSGDVFSTSKLRKGIDSLRNLYGEFGYIDFVAEPSFDPLPGSDKLDLTLNMDEGKQFFVRRIDFSGNSTTRDKVIRRELLLDEGAVYNTKLWEISILRLNQLGYFEALKKEDAADIKRDTKTNTVDITLKVKERGKNSVQLNGGVSGIAGSFIGFGYSTNNFLGLGETLSLDSQIGDRIRNVTLGFTEPWLFDRPIQSGFTIYTTRFSFDQGREVSLLSGRDLTALFNTLGKDNLLNYVSNGYGFTVFASYPLRRSFARLSLTYGYDRSKYSQLSTAANTYFQYINFQGLAGSNQLTGIHTSKVTPAYQYNTVNHPITPTAGRSLFISLPFAGSVLGGNVNSIEPTVDAKYFHSSPINRKHVIGLHVLGRFLSGYGGKVAPPFGRFYMGGENDIRGFDIWSISPFAYVPTETPNVPVLNADGSARVQKTIVNGVVTQTAVTMTMPTYQLIFPGGDTQLVWNSEYRIPIAGPVWLALFGDAGVNRVTRESQLTLNPDRLATLNGAFPQAAFTGRAPVVAGTQTPRMSTGIELQVMMPVVNAPFRLYWAYNPLLAQTYLQPPIVADRSMFPNNATFLNSIATYGRAIPWFERRHIFRFTIGRTF